MTAIAAIGAGASAVLAWRAVSDGRKVIEEAHRQADAAWEQVSEERNQTLAALDQARIAKAAFISSNRAWLQLKVSQADATLDWSDGIPELDMDPEILNIGHGPALDVSFWAELRIGYDASKPNEIANYCQSSPGGNDTIFPGQDLVDTNHAGAVLPPSSLQKFVARYQRPGLPLVIPIYLVACVRYRVPEDEDFHSTGRAFAIRDNRPDRGGGFVVVGQSIPQGAVSLNPGTVGSDAVVAPIRFTTWAGLGAQAPAGYRGGAPNLSWRRVPTAGDPRSAGGLGGMPDGTW